jgi:hypothetical protein
MDPDQPVVSCHGGDKLLHAVARRGIDVLESLKELSEGCVCRWNVLANPHF